MEGRTRWMDGGSGKEEEEGGGGLVRDEVKVGRKRRAVGG